MKSNSVTEESKELLLEHCDFISTKKFLYAFVEKEKIKEFTEIRNNNQSCNNAVYLLWKTCIDKLELAESEESQCEQVSTSKNHSQHNVMEDNVSSSDYVCEGRASESNDNSALTQPSQNAIDESTPVILNPEKSIQVILADDDQSIIDLVDIPVVDVSNINNLDEISVIAHSSLYNTDTDQSSDIKIIGIEKNIEKSFSDINPKSVTDMNDIVTTLLLK